VQTLQQWKNGERKLCKIVQSYEPKNIYNAEKTGLLFRLPPNKTLSLKGNPCNAEGTKKLPPITYREE
jgi:hypothetical protein